MTFKDYLREKNLLESENIYITKEDVVIDDLET